MSLSGAHIRLPLADMDRPRCPTPAFSNLPSVSPVNSVLPYFLWLFRKPPPTSRSIWLLFRGKCHLALATTGHLVYCHDERNEVQPGTCFSSRRHNRVHHSSGPRGNVPQDFRRRCYCSEPPAPRPACKQHSTCKCPYIIHRDLSRTFRNEQSTSLNHLLDRATRRRLLAKFGDAIRTGVV